MNGLNEKQNTFYQNLKKTKVTLHFENGKTFKGWINKDKSDPIISSGLWGEAAFTTGMSGYQETMSDPSFLGQHLIFATSHVGNYESNEKVMQSKGIHAVSIIARNFSYNEFLANTEKPLITLEDTRELVKFLTKNECSHQCVFTIEENTPNKDEFKNDHLICNELNRVSQEHEEIINPGESPIVLINYGVKQAIVDYLAKLGKPLVTVPYNVSKEQILKYDPSLIFLSNGPGDPRAYTDQVKVVKELLETNIPIRGICLGHQLLGLAMDAEIIKLPFGQRGINHPVYDHTNDSVVITSQNHGYAIEESSIDQNKFRITHRSLFDRSVEGIATKDSKIRSVQFHPEANPGPTDALNFFKEIGEYLSANGNVEEVIEKFPLPNQELNKEIPYKKILIIGSGPIKIGQASEFDYSGTQACKALRQIGIQVVLLNSNPATIMTDPQMADATYIEPINPETILKIIKKEKVDAILSTMGGQTALNTCIELEKEGILKDNNVQLLGAKVDTIEKTEDRELFARELDTLGYHTGKRFSAGSQEEAENLASSKVGFPLIIRRDFALGGSGAALVHSVDELKEVFTGDLKFPITLEKSLLGWKEVELEVMVDSQEQGVIICSIENIDPCGVHTGDSITVAPAMTISDRCMQKMRDMSLTIAKHMGVVAGGANVQFAINPMDEDDIVVIEMNPRVSRSSALASKATGYPIAKISAFLAVGYGLKDILNDITKVSPVVFEPSLDYVAVKIPIFPFSKFPSTSQLLGPQMRSVGEALALGGNFTEAFMKALRSLEIGLEIPSLKQLKQTPIDMDENYIRAQMSKSHQLSLLTVLEALRMGISPKEVFDITAISPWFIEQMVHVNLLEERITSDEEQNITPQTLRELKKVGFSDKYIAYLLNKSQSEIFNLRIEHGIVPTYKAVDTCSGEFSAVTPYFYSTFAKENEAKSLSLHEKSVAIMGSGPNRIGQGIEFDYSCVKSCQRLREKNYKAIMINSNPETVSTDYDISDRLYLSPLYSEDLFDIFLNEKPSGIITAFSGQTGIKVRHHLEDSFRKEHYKLPFLGATLETLDLTEDRKQFETLTKNVDLSRTKAMEVQGYKKLMNAMIEIGLPVIIRPSYVIGGESMFIFYTHDEVEELPETYKNQLKSSNTTFQIENYLENALEYDVDLIRDQKGNCVFTVCEHIEYAGVHSGDSGMITPPVVLTSSLYKELKKISLQLAELLNLVGPINIQYAIKDGKIYCIEANPRGSRTLPFLSKAYNITLPAIATDAMLGEEIPNFDREESNYFAVKQSTFPFDRFLQDNIILGPKMRSTGETMGLDQSKEEAILKSLLGNYPKLNKRGKVLISLSDRHKEILIPYLKRFNQMGYEFCATKGTAQYIKKQGVPCETISKISDIKGKSIIEAIKDENLVMVFNTPLNQGQSKSDGEYIRNSAIQYGVPCFTRPENIKAVIESIIGSHEDLKPCSLQESVSVKLSTPMDYNVQ